jgi:1,4-alpha-glucan branching enzyme
MRRVPERASQTGSTRAAPGELAIVLHTHMPYVEGGGEWPNPNNPPTSPKWEGFGTWPFGEEWLWEAIATSYVPLLDVLERHAPAPVTLSLTPVLCDQLEAPGAVERCIAFLDGVRTESHRLDIEEYTGRGDTATVAQLRRSAAEYARAGERLQGLAAREGGLLAALGAHASWTSAATHAILPLLCLDEAIDLQLRTGIESHRARFGEWQGGLWLPECAHAPWLHEHLADAGVRATCVELTATYGLGDPRHLQPLATDEGPVLWPIDRATIALVWGQRGYPAQAAYRAYDRRTPRHHRAWSIDGTPYDPDRADDQARADAHDFVQRVRDRVAGGGVCVCAVDTELLGHWWYEGPRWLEHVLHEAARQGLALTTLDDALERHAPARAPGDLRPSSWGEGGDLRTWSGPPVADLAWQARSAELQAFAAAAGPPPPRALRELLALQSSDWAFLAYRQWSGEYPRERARAHAAALAQALRDRAGGLAPELRHLAPRLVT